MKVFCALFLICTASIATCSALSQTNEAPWLAGIYTHKPVEIAGSNVYSRIPPACIPYPVLSPVPDRQVHSSTVLSRKEAKRRSRPAFSRFISHIFHKKREKDTTLSIPCRVFSIFRKSHAGTILTFSSNTIQITPGKKIKVIGTLTNTGATDIHINGDSFVIKYPDLSIDDSPFIFFGPLHLLPCHSYKGAFIEVTADAKLQTGSYSGTFTIQGGADTNSFDDLATVNITFEFVSNSASREP